MTAKILQHPHPWSRRVAIAHGGRLVRSALRRLLEAQPGIEVVGEAGDGAAAVAMAYRLRPDAIVVDVDLAGIGGLEATRRIVAASSIAVVVLSPSRSHPVVRAALDAGAASVVLEDGEPSELFAALRLCAPTREENPMLSPNVVEIRRGSAHVAAARPLKPAPARGPGSRIVRFPRPALVLQ
jgi:DNA-binding NarL/FixJ family response regulator